MYVAPDASPPSSDICLVRGCYGVSLVVRGVSRAFSGVSEPGRVLGKLDFSFSRKQTCSRICEL